VAEAVRRRDGPFGDYSQAPPERQPRREHVIEPDPGAAGLTPRPRGRRRARPGAGASRSARRS
jgi:hypothetical protein